MKKNVRKTKFSPKDKSRWYSNKTPRTGTWCFGEAADHPNGTYGWDLGPDDVGYRQAGSDEKEVQLLGYFRIPRPDWWPESVTKPVSPQTPAAPSVVSLAAEVVRLTELDKIKTQWLTALSTKLDALELKVNPPASPIKTMEANFAPKPPTLREVVMSMPSRDGFEGAVSFSLRAAAAILRHEAKSGAYTLDASIVMERLADRCEKEAAHA